MLAAAWRYPHVESLRIVVRVNLQEGSALVTKQIDWVHGYDLCIVQSRPVIWFIGRRKFKEVDALVTFGWLRVRSFDIADTCHICIVVVKDRFPVDDSDSAVPHVNGIHLGVLRSDRTPC